MREIRRTCCDLSRRQDPIAVGVGLLIGVEGERVLFVEHAVIIIILIAGITDLVAVGVRLV